MLQAKNFIIYKNGIVFLNDVDGNCVDYLEIMVKMYDAKYPDKCYGDRIVVLRGEMDDVCLPDDSFSVVFLTNVHVHITDPRFDTMSNINLQSNLHYGKPFSRL